MENEPKGPGGPLPVVRRIAWIALVPQGMLLATLVGGVRAAFPDFRFEETLWVGAAPFLVHSMAVRPLLLRHHRRGVRLLREERYAEAIPAFEASHAFLARHPWLDRFRYVALMSASVPSYREMALCYTGFALFRTGETTKARRFFERALAEHPRSAMAIRALSAFPEGGTAPDR